MGLKLWIVVLLYVNDNDYKLDPDTFETITNDEGESVLNEDFSSIISEFKEWCANQEIDLKRKFLG